MQQFLDQAKENEQFLADVEQAFPTSRFDWKTTLIFYTALHWMKAFLISQHGFKSPETHAEVRAIYRENKHIMKEDVYKVYNKLQELSNIARYHGIIPDKATWLILREKEYRNAKELLERFRKYLIGRGMNI